MRGKPPRAAFAAQSPEDEAEILRAIGLPLAEAAIAHRQGDWARAVATLLPVRPLVAQIGGSHAQRDVFARLLIDAALQAGRSDVVSLLVREREQQRAPRRLGRATDRARRRRKPGVRRAFLLEDGAMPDTTQIRAPRRNAKTSRL